MTAEEHARIAEAVQAAEAKTSGEIYCVVARASDSYFFPAAFMVTLAHAGDQPARRLSARVLVVRFACRCSWSPRSSSPSPARLLVLGFFPALRIHLVPRRLRYRRAHDNALKQFLAATSTSPRRAPAC